MRPPQPFQRCSASSEPSAAPPELEVADVFRRHGPAYRHAHADHLGRTERRVMAAIEACRTPVLGGHVEHCADCGLVRCAYNSCRDRHCPKCQALARADWLDARQAELLPVPYFHVVFTLPTAVAEIAFHNKAVVYAILFRAAAEALRRVAADPRYLGAEIGAVAVLHTWGQALHHHPHLHCIVPGGGIAPDQTRWIACKPGFFLPVRVLSRQFRDLFLAIANSRLVGLDDGRVSFTWKDYRQDDKTKVMTIAADEFIRRFLQHTVPDGFHRIRHIGFLANRHRTAKLTLCRDLLAAPPPPGPEPPRRWQDRLRDLTGHDVDVCPSCRGRMLPYGTMRPCPPPRPPTWCDSS